MEMKGEPLRQVRGRKRDYQYVFCSKLGIWYPTGTAVIVLHMYNYRKAIHYTTVLCWTQSQF